jgi:hypothetical protein
LVSAPYVAPQVRSFSAGSDGHPAAILDVAGFGVRLRVVDNTGGGVADQVAMLMPPDLIVAPSERDSRADRRYVVEPHGSDLTVTTDGEQRLTKYERAGTVAWLRDALDATIAIRASTSVFIHSGVVGWRGRGVLLPGGSGAGKTSLVEALVRQGATYYSDEYAAIDDHGVVHAYARVPAPKGDRPVRHLLPVAPRTSLPPLPVDAIIATRYVPGASWRPLRQTGARALLPLLENAIVAADQPERVMGVISQLRPTLCLTGDRPDAAAIATDLLESLD